MTWSDASEVRHGYCLRGLPCRVSRGNPRVDLVGWGRGTDTQYVDHAVNPERAFRSGCMEALRVMEEGDTGEMWISSCWVHQRKGG